MCIPAALAFFALEMVRIGSSERPSVRIIQMFGTPSRSPLAGVNISLCIFLKTPAVFVLPGRKLMFRTAFNREFFVLFQTKCIGLEN